MFWRIFAVPLCLAVLGTAALAQDQGQRGERDRGTDRGGERRGEFRGGGGGGFDPQQMRQRIVERMKEQLGASDEDWKELEPRIERVFNLQRSTRMGGFGAMGFGGRGGEGQQDQSEVARASRELRSTLDNPNASAQEIEQRLTAYREAREKSEKELTQARTELKELLTQRQEAQLVMLGLLE
jgi:hypothetical protein